MNDLKKRAKEILDREEYKKPRSGSIDHRVDFPDENHPDQRGWRTGDSGKAEPNGV